jgi:hypothetical protein
MRSKTVLVSIVAAGLAFGATYVLAQQHRPGMMGPSMPMGPRGMGMMDMMAGCPMMGATTDGQASAFVEGRIAFLKAELAITDPQKAAWDAYANALKRNLESTQGMGQMMRAVFEAKTPVERLDAHLAAMETRIKTLQDLKPVLAKLYEALSADQKKKADEILTGMGCMM